MAHKRIPPLSDSDRARFRRFLRRDSLTGCLLWIGSHHGRGYGQFSIKGEQFYAHRVAFIEGGGVLTEEKPHVLHDCPAGDQPACCEFEHLWAGSDADNLNDMSRKGRGVRSGRGFPYGVQPSHGSKRFQATIRIKGQYIRLGCYATVEEAAAVALAARDEARRRR